MKTSHLIFMVIAMTIISLCPDLPADNIAHVANLRCEYLVNPQGIDELKPRLSWTLQSSRRGQKQKAYRILVASAPEKLNKDLGDLWDSGMVNSDQSLQVVYNGKPLQSRMRCFWKVKIWPALNELDTPNTKSLPWSDTANWSMGLLERCQWKGKWIGLKLPDEVAKSEDLRYWIPARYLRKEFALKKTIKQATAYISGLGYYKLFINGDRIGDHELDPILRDYEKQVPYVTYDVSNALRQGDNVLGVMLGSGRYWAPRPEQQKYDQPCLLMQLEIVYEDNSTETILSDKSWRATDEGPIRENNEFDGETYDARMEIENWNNTGCTFEKWKPADIMNVPFGGPYGVLTSAAVMQPMRITGTLKPVKLTEPEDGVWVFDMGQNMVGLCTLKVNGPAGATVKMHFSENIYPDGNIDTRNLRSAKCTDTYILNDNGEQTYTPSFTYHGFRYVEMRGFPGTPTLDTLTGLVINTDMPFAGDFKCSDPTITQVLKNARWGIRGNYLSIPTDCPQRQERQGWQGDRAGQQLGEIYLFDNIALYEKWMGDIRDSQKATGVLCDLAPNYWLLYSGSVTWPANFVIVPGNLYRQYGDKRAIERNYPAMEKWVDFLRCFARDGILDNDLYGDWCCPPEDKHLIHSQQEWRKTPKEVLATCYYYYVLTLMADYADLLDNKDKAANYRTEAAKIKQAFNQKLYDAEKGCYGNGSQTSQILPLRFGLVPPERREKIFSYIVNHIETKTGGAIGTGVVGGQWLMRTLSDNGRLDIAYRFATRREYPSWGYMIEKGATTIWELWNGDTASPDMNSGNHVMLLGDLITWMFEYLGGIQADLAQPGFKHIIMNPQFPEGLTFARAEHNSPYGLIVSDWKIEDDVFQWEITVPANTAATIYIPASKASEVTENGQVAQKADGVKFLRMKDNRAVFAIGSGSYKFATKNSSFFGSSAKCVDGLPKKEGRIKSEQKFSQ